MAEEPVIIIKSPAGWGRVYDTKGLLTAMAKDATLNSVLKAIQDLQGITSPLPDIRDILNGILSTNQNIDSKVATEDTVDGILNSLIDIDSKVATEATLKTLLTTAQSIDSKVATENTLSNILSTNQDIDGKVATENTLNSILNVNTAIRDKVATEATLGNLLSRFNAVSDEDEVRVDPYQTISTYSNEWTNIASADLTDNIITPPSGERLSIRDWCIASNSTTGTIRLRFATSDKVVGVLYISTAGGGVSSVPTIGVVHPCNIKGNIDEPLTLEWTNLDTGSNVFVQTNYKVVS